MTGPGPAKFSQFNPKGEGASSPALDKAGANISKSWHAYQHKRNTRSRKNLILYNIDRPIVLYQGEYYEVRGASPRGVSIMALNPENHFYRFRFISHENVVPISNQDILELKVLGYDIPVILV